MVGWLGTLEQEVVAELISAAIIAIFGSIWTFMFHRSRKDMVALLNQIAKNTDPSRKPDRDS